VKFPGANHLIVHLKSESQAECMKEAIGKRLAQCSLKLHPEKTKIVYCKDVDRKGSYPNQKFDFRAIHLGREGQRTDGGMST
jgi:RNA-directed DNA polymerase